MQRLGLVVGGLGVVVVVGPWAYLADVATAAPLPAVLACLGATACYGLGTTYQRRFVVPLRLPPETVAAGQVSAGALLLALASPLVATGPVHLTWPVVLSMLGLGALGTGLAYVWTARIIAAWGAQRASTARTRHRSWVCCSGTPCWGSGCTGTSRSVAWWSCSGW